MYIEEEFVRAAPGGAGGVKAISNYAPVSEFSPTLIEKLVVVVISSTPEFHQGIRKAKAQSWIKVFAYPVCFHALSLPAGSESINPSQEQRIFGCLVP